MSIRFKFRSSVNFDSIDIDDNKPYISVAQLRSKILLQKKLNGVGHKDFDLVFFDHLTGQEYNDDEFKIPSGSSVIIKRVPAEPVASPILRHHKLEPGEPSGGVPKVIGMDLSKPEEIVQEKKLAPEDREHIKLERVANTKGIDLEKVDLPSELRCPICSTYFKEAVMIPCCQHSFCKKCICELLPRTARCPKCSSTKHRVEHLLPNLSLRHAIEHFMESQILATTPENDLQKYVPDGESCIQGKEVSTVTKRKLDLLYPTSATEKGSNQNMAESVFFEGAGFNTGKSCAINLLNSTPNNNNNNNGGINKQENLRPSTDSQGENQPVVPQVCMPDEADSTSRKRGLWVNSGGGDRSYAIDNRNRKAGRTCYRCGSPSHFIRDCPMSSSEHTMYHAGDHIYQGGMPGHAMMPYWNATSFPPVNPYMNMYGNPGMMPFSPTMVPVTPYGISPYVPSAYGTLPVPSGLNGGMAPMGARFEQPSRHSENLDYQNSDNQVKYSHEKRRRSSDYEDDSIQKRHDYHGPERSSEYKSHTDRGKGLSNSEESYGRKLQKDYLYDKNLDQRDRSGHGRYDKHSHSTHDKRDHGSSHTDRSVSGVEDVHSGSYRYDEPRYKNKKHHESSRQHHNSREHSGSDCSFSRHQINKEKDVKRRYMEDDSDYDYHHKRKRVH
ncbi:uncharacterized protein [Rutidosis leptorrhynchoides]|uniref:uncharacterized protein n=1 Tax=Rutidosis leptorrhynchoides TaxID=125765 RepID=UPI003A9A1912